MEKTEQYLKKLLTNFPTYLNYVYKHIGLPETTPLQGRIADILNDNPNRLILMAARGVGKSYIAAIYSSWRLLRNPDEKVLIVSASGPKAAEIATFLRNLFERVPLLETIAPGPEQRDSVLSFDIKGGKVSIAPSVSCLGVTSQITGKRASLVLADDIEVPSNSMTEDMRAKLIQRTTEFEALLIPEMQSSILMLGTPQSLESVYNKMEYPKVILPAEVPEDEMVYNGALDPWIFTCGKPGDATDKVRFPKSVLLERKAGMGAANYRLQYLLDTTLSDAERFPLKCKDMIVMPLDKYEAPMTVNYAGTREYALDIPILGFTGDTYHKPYRVSDIYKPYERKIMSIDPSGSGQDETTYAIFGVLAGNLYLLEWGGSRKGYAEETLVMLAEKAKEYNVNEIVPEKNFGSGMFTELLKKVLIHIYPCSIVEDFNVRGQKERRIIDNVGPILGKHQLVVNETMIREEADWVNELPVERLQYSLMYQLTHITYDRDSIPHDDRLDAIAIGCQYLADSVIVDADNALKQLKEAEMEKWLEEKVYGKYTPPKATVLPHQRGDYNIKLGL